MLKQLSRWFVLALACQLSLVGMGWAQASTTLLTDADSTVREICRWDNAQDICYEPRGTADHVADPWDDDPGYLRVHTDNALDVAYLHFDLSGLAPSAQVSEARFQLDIQSVSWGDANVMVTAIMDDKNDWDLNAVPESQIYGANAPFADWSDWEDDPANAHRFNQPTPFLDESDTKGAKVRELVDPSEPIYIPTTDPETSGTPEAPGNSYGGYSEADGPGTGGSSDGGQNPWPVKNAVDIDVTDLIKWKLGQNANYSTFTPSDKQLTLMVRSEAGNAGFARFVAKESPYLGGELGLQPGRLVMKVTGGLTGDFDNDGALDIDDVNALNAQIKGNTNPVAYDLTGDNKVDSADLANWIHDLKHTWIGDADLDGSFGSADLVQVFVAGKYEVETNAGWDDGDWTGDQRFGSDDLVAAFIDGGYEAGPRAAVSAVPEPSALCLALVGLLGLRRRSK